MPSDPHPRPRPRRQSGPRAAPRPIGPGPHAGARAAAGFAAGALIPFATWLVALPALGAWGFYGAGSIARPVAVLGAACAAGGIVAGGAIGGTRWRAAFGAAFCTAAWVPLLLLSGLPALGGRESAVELAAVFVPGFASAFAVLGAVGLGLAGGGWRSGSMGAFVFGAAGAAGGAVVAAAAGLAPGAAGFGVQSLGGGAAYLLPAAAGGWWIGCGIRSGRQRHRARS